MEIIPWMEPYLWTEITRNRQGLIDTGEQVFLEN